jgi:hypothetical protein
MDHFNLPLMSNGTVQISNHLDEIDAPAWAFINAEAYKVGGKTGHIESYQYEHACGGVVVLWDSYHLHALAITIRDTMNRTRCIRVLTQSQAEQDAAKLASSQKESFDQWWEQEGQHLQEGLGEQEKAFALKLLRSLKGRSLDGL